MPSPTVVVALGSNLGDSALILEQAICRLAALAQGPVRRSSLWRTTPVDCPPGSPAFLNAVVAFEPHPGETPGSMLKKLQDLEREFGREPKKILNEARPLDLDLIAFGSMVRSSARLTLPHPRAHLRRFVLAPLNEVAPDLVLPGQSQSIAALLQSLVSDEKVQRVRG